MVAAGTIDKHVPRGTYGGGSCRQKCSLRTVLLKYYDARGYVFFTNYTSRKAREIESNPEICMMLPCITLERQIIVYGRAEKISRAETLKYFLSRPRA